MASGELAWCIVYRIVAHLEERLLVLRIGFVAQRGVCNESA